jgi:stage II sporulation protein D
VLSVNGKPAPGAWRLTPAAEGDFITVGNNFYRGTIIVKATGDGKLTVINELDIDDYLKGVLPRETVATWHEEALKTQAVASRTYLASHLSRHADQGFDLCADVHCQVYGGATKEHPRTNAAVDATKGEILIYDNKPISAFFSDNCGGATEGVRLVWGQADQPYLRSRRCPWSDAAPRNEWRLTMNDTEMLNALRAKGLVKGDELKGVFINKKGPSGRASSMDIRTNAGTFTMLANDFRIALGPEKVRSTMFTHITKLQGGYLFTGRGWGHGVGMCQWGSKGLAEQGKDYRDILAYYYPGTSLALWSRQ